MKPRTWRQATTEERQALAELWHFGEYAPSFDPEPEFFASVKKFLEVFPSLETPYVFHASRHAYKKWGPKFTGTRAWLDFYLKHEKDIQEFGAMVRFFEVG